MLLQSKVVVGGAVVPFTTADAGTPTEEAEDVEWPLTSEVGGAIQKPLPRVEIRLCIVLNVVGNSMYQTHIYLKKVKPRYSAPHTDVL